EGISLVCYGSSVNFPGQAAEAVRFAVSREDFRVADLPGGLDDAGKLVLVRRLVREGVLQML
ncbi:MAG: cupin, partial [Deltaproteobacteria bacterium]